MLPARRWHSLRRGVPRLPPHTRLSISATAQRNNMSTPRTPEHNSPHGMPRSAQKAPGGAPPRRGATSARTRARCPGYGWWPPACAGGPGLPPPGSAAAPLPAPAPRTRVSHHAPSCAACLQPPFWGGRCSVAIPLHSHAPSCHSSGAQCSTAVPRPLPHAGSHIGASCHSMCL